VKTPAAARGAWVIPLGLMLLALVGRLLQVFMVNLDADMTVAGLMASHILKGHFPVFFYGQAFAGSIEAYIAAPIFALAGPGTVTLCLAPILVSLVFVWLAYTAGKDMWGRRAGLFCMALAALPPYFFMWHSFLPRSCYIEIPTLSLLMLWLAWRLVHRERPAWLYFLYGLAAGVGLWTHFLIAYALAASALYLLLADWRVLFRRGLPLMLAGFVLGATPLWIYNFFIVPGGTFTYLMGLTKTSTPTEALGGFITRAWPTLVGAMQDTTGQALAPVFFQVVLGTSLAVGAYLLWQRRRGIGGLLRFDPKACDGSEIFLVMLLMVVIITTIKGESVGSSRRHFVPAYAALIPLAGYAVDRLWGNRPLLGKLLLAVMLAANLTGIAVNTPLFNSTLYENNRQQIRERQELIQALLDRGITRAFALDYWNCPSLTFESGERLVVVQPQVELDHFYEPHARLVASAPSQAWICRRETYAFRAMLEAMGARYQTLQVGGFTVFHDAQPPAAGWREVSRQGWSGTATPHNEDAGLALDGDTLTRWSPLAKQKPWQTYTLDMGRIEQNISLVRLCSGREDDQPVGVNLELSQDGVNWVRVRKANPLDRTLHWAAGTPRAAANNPRLDLVFPPQAARYLRLVLTNHSPLTFWSLMEISVYAPAPALPRDPQALLARVRQAGIKHLYAEEVLQSHLPLDLRPARQTPPQSPAWPLDLLPRSVLPADLDGAGLAVEAHAGDELGRFLDQRGYRFSRDVAGGYALFWDLAPPVNREAAISLAGARATSCHPGEEARALDGNLATRWDSGRPRQAGDFFALDLGREQVVGSLRLDSRGSPRDLPPGLRHDLSNDGVNWSQVDSAAEPGGPLVFADDRLLGANPGLVTLRFPPQTARHLRLSLSQGHPSSYWSLHEVTPLGPGGK
jgi:hypothetical protein